MQQEMQISEKIKQIDKEIEKVMAGRQWRALPLEICGALQPLICQKLAIKEAQKSPVGKVWIMSTGLNGRTVESVRIASLQSLLDMEARVQPYGCMSHIGGGWEVEAAFPDTENFRRFPFCKERP